MNTKIKFVQKFLKQRKGIVGLETAIIMIAFIIIAAAFSFMVVNQGLIATEKSKSVIQQGLATGTPLIVDGSIMVRTASTVGTVDYIVIPVKSFGTSYVNMGRNQTSIMLKVGDKMFANAYLGTLRLGYPNATGSVYNSTSTVYDPTGHQFDDFIGFQYSNQTMDGQAYSNYVNETYSIGKMKGLITGIVFAISNSNGDEALNSGEAGYILVALGHGDEATARTNINLEIRIQGSATVTLDFTLPASMPANSYINVA
jgi:flagellin FlaB